MKLSPKLMDSLDTVLSNLFEQIEALVDQVGRPAGGARARKSAENINSMMDLYERLENLKGENEEILPKPAAKTAVKKGS